MSKRRIKELRKDYQQTLAEIQQTEQRLAELRQQEINLKAEHNQRVIDAIYTGLKLSGGTYNTSDQTPRPTAPGGPFLVYSIHTHSYSVSGSRGELGDGDPEPDRNYREYTYYLDKLPSMSEEDLATLKATRTDTYPAKLEGDNIYFLDTHSKQWVQHPPHKPINRRDLDRPYLPKVAEAYGIGQLIE